MPKVISRPMGENSPNPVTLSTSSCCELWSFWRGPIYNWLQVRGPPPRAHLWTRAPSRDICFCSWLRRLWPFRTKQSLLRRGIVVTASTAITEDPGFESHQGVRFLGLYTLQCCCQNLICIVIMCIWEK
jgi:hypothetical protein